VSSQTIVEHFNVFKGAYPDTLNDTFSYDAASRLTSAVSGRYSNTVARTYDSASRRRPKTDWAHQNPPDFFTEEIWKKYALYFCNLRGRLSQA